MGVTHLSALEVTGSVQSASVQSASVQSATQTVTGTTTLGPNVRVSSAANVGVGLAAIATGAKGSTTVTNTQVRSSSRILLTPISGVAYKKKAVFAYVGTIASGASFKVWMSRCQTAGTVATASGRIAYQIINK